MKNYSFIAILMVVTLQGCGKSEFAGSSGVGSTNKKKKERPAPTSEETVFNNKDPNKQPPKFGMLVNDLRCSFCHVQVRGDVVSLTTVDSLWGGSVGWVNGNWTMAGQFKANNCSAADGCANATSTPKVTISGQRLENNTASKSYPRNPDSGAVTFPLVDWVAAKSASKQKFDSNKVLVGTNEAPIDVTGDVYVEGDLIIKGRYKGAGTIYVNGNVYVPANLTAMQSPFPYSSDPLIALDQAEKALKDKKDALAIASAKSIVIGSFEKRFPGTSDAANDTSVFTHQSTSPEDRGAALGLMNGENWTVYNWHPKAQFDTLWDTTNPAPTFCKNGWGNAMRTPVAALGRYVSRIDAFLYAVKAVGGRSNDGSYAINGGLIADHFHVITGARECSPGTHPVHGYEANRSHINYDWRLKVGLGLLTHMGKYFKEP